jgi:hypothetical protein
MREAGLTATVVTYTSLLNLHVKREGGVGAHGVMEAMREAGLTAAAVTGAENWAVEADNKNPGNP